MDRHIKRHIYIEKVKILWVGPDDLGEHQEGWKGSNRLKKNICLKVHIRPFKAFGPIFFIQWDVWVGPDP